MPKIIALEAPPRRGKSPTINILYGLMLRRGYDLVKDRRIIGSRDFFVIFKKKKKKIGVTSYGDSVALIERRLEHFMSNGCKIMICACHPEGVTKLAVQRYPGCSKEYFPKTIIRGALAQEIRVNTNDAEEIIKRIESLL